MPALPSWMRNADGTPATVEKVSPTAVRWTYKQPNTLLLTALANQDGGDRTYAVFLPAHYLKRFHPTHAKKDEVDKLVAAAGFKTWTELFAARNAPPENPERPTMAAWTPATRVSDQVFTLRRNPYFVGVDPSGNQLPYLDEVRFTFFADIQALNLSRLQGEREEGEVPCHHVADLWRGRRRRPAEPDVQGRPGHRQAPGHPGVPRRALGGHQP